MITIIELQNVRNRLNTVSNHFWDSLFQSFEIQLQQGRTLSEKQEACVFKALAQAEKAEAKAKAKAQPVASLSEIAKGRYEVVFTVTHLKAYETGGYSWHYETIKAVGQTDKGFKVYVSIPEALQGQVQVGSKVAMTATVTPKEDGFASLTRPFNVRLIEG